MAAMMLPALTPMVVAYSRRAASPVATAAFSAGYLAAWLAAGFAAYAAIETVRAFELRFLGWNESGRFVAAAVIAGAGLYELSKPKRACLRRCCERSAFLDEHFRPGAPGALRMGVEHGGYCVGSSWALMSALFALGVMSLTWMALVAVLIAAERVLPRATRMAVVLVFAMLGTGVALVPGRMPGLTVRETESMSQMQMR
jgi:predicted metal-binding membrane protein